ncbi:MAG: hypothetical protein SNJ82_03180, partial [Gemmataceae bacterium]
YHHPTDLAVDTARRIFLSDPRESNRRGIEHPENGKTVKEIYHVKTHHNVPWSPGIEVVHKVVHKKDLPFSSNAKYCWAT